MDQSLRGFLSMVEKTMPEELVRVRQPVRRELDITATVFEFERHGKSPVVFFEKVEGFDMPVVTNTTGNRKVLAAAMEVSPAELPTAYKDRRFPKWPGAVATALWWYATTLLLPPTLSLLGGYDRTYGSLAGVMITLIFFFLVGLGVVIGAELNAALAEFPEEEDAPAADI